ncbi:ABC transporter permease [bacterium]|nr:ABC transporter permease [bacterium]
MGLKKFIIKKHLISEGRHFFTNFSAFVSILGVSIGVAALIVVLSVTSGFQKAYQEKILSHSGQIFVRKYGGLDNYRDDIEKIKSIKGIIGATPMTYYQILISSENGDRGAQMKGIDADTIGTVADINSMLSPKDALSKLKKSEKPSVFLGSALAESLRLKVSDNVTITFPFDKDGRVSSFPKVITFEIVGIVNTGMYDFDNNYLYISLIDAHRLFDTEGKVKGIEVKIENIKDVDSISTDIKLKLGNYPYVVSTFKEMYSNLFRSLQYQKFFIGLVMIIIIILASFSIIGTLLIFVTEKEKDIALLKAMGVSKLELTKLFMFEGGMIGLLGILIGILIAFLILFGISSINIELNPDIYNITYIPISINLLEFVSVILITLFISILSTIYPALKAATLNPADGILGRSINR